jgi:glucosamine-6-phosphate deaminase
VKILSIFFHKICLKKRIDVAKFASNVITEQLSVDENSVLGLATGSTPEQTYRELVNKHIADQNSWSQVRTVNLDEYYGLDRNNPQSYHHYMQVHLFNHVDIPEYNTLFPNGTTSDPAAEARNYEKKIVAWGGIDLWLVGIGSNGHIAFNEPGSSRNCRTRLVRLSDKTISDNSRLFEKKADVPTQALTAGIATIMEARKILLIATGEKKSAAINAALNNPIGPNCPASFLRQHPNCTFVVDEAAAGLCRNNFR